MRFTPRVLPSRKGNLGILELNHPKILHALTSDMIDCMTDVWSDYTAPNSHIRAILLKADNTDTKVRAFCAGGDVKSVYTAGKEGDSLTADFFRHEYTLNHKMATSKIPQVSLWDGVVMGGGAGISVHGKYRVATEHAKFSMPETAIGLFCDVGSMWWMPRLLKGGLCNYVALTGARLKPLDLLFTGLATHYVPSDQLPALEDALVEATASVENATEDDVVAPVLNKFHQDNPDPLDSFLAQHQTLIDESFQERTVEQIVENLESLDHEFARSTLATLHKMSPTSLKVTLEGLHRGAATNSIGEALQMEYRMAQACMRLDESDFYEGIRAVLVDKDHAPNWHPSTLKDVTPAMVESYFAPLDEEWEIPAASAKL